MSVWGGIGTAIGAAGGFLLGGPVGAMAGASALGGLGASFDQNEANSANAQQAVSQMQFQERMSNTAHQREVADLRAAGLNPLLSANAGAGTPGGAMATMESTGGPAQQGIANANEAIAKMKGLQQQETLNNSTIASNLANIGLMQKKGVTEAANASIAQQGALQSKMQTQLMAKGLGAKLNWADWEPMIHNMKDITGAAANAVQAGAIGGAAMKYMKKPRLTPGDNPLNSPQQNEWGRLP